jgi:acetylornithine deacetylase/succinyl-diaminopimelate desuccinylase-like protein
MPAQKRFFFLCACLMICAWCLQATSRPAVAADNPALQARAYVAKNKAAILGEFADLLSIPNLASDSENIRRNAERIVSLLQRRGMDARLLEVPGAPPYVYGELHVPGATRTVAFYAHYDGQPVDRAQWATPPWTPVLRDGPLEQGGKEIPLAGAGSRLGDEWRLYARSASDDKAPIIAMLAALDALRAAGISPSVNLKFFFEGEEEAGSPHLQAAFEKYAGVLQADAWLLCDGPVHQSRRLQLYFGARGLTDAELTLYGPTRALHSGHYGNWAPNPAMALVHLLSSLRDPDGSIRIPGFYDDVRPLTAEENQALAAIPAVEPQLLAELGLDWTEGRSQGLARLITQPGINLRGIESGHVGEKTQNAIPTEAIASLDFRLVPDQTPEKVRARFEAFLREHGYFVVSAAPDAETRKSHPRIVGLRWGPGYPAGRTSMSLPFSRAVITAIEAGLGAPVVKMPTLGGSVPMYLFQQMLKAPVIGLPIVNHDNNQHAANENLRLKNLWDGVEVFAALFARLGHDWQ